MQKAWLVHIQIKTWNFSIQLYLYLSLSVEEALNAPPPSGRKGQARKRTKGATNVSGDFRVEYAKSSKSTCKGCEEKIVKGETRISKKDYESEEARKFGGLDRWHHVECFAKLRVDFSYYESGDQLSGAEALSKEDLQSLKAALPKMTKDDVPPPPKKVKSEPEDKKETQEIKKQNNELYAIKDQISSLRKHDLMAILEQNCQKVPTGTSNVSISYGTHINHTLLKILVYVTKQIYYVFNRMLFTDYKSFV